MPEHDPAKKWFRCTDAERAAFEAGIKLGAVYHQFVGLAVDRKGVEAVERAIEASVRAQPCVEDVTVRIDRKAVEGAAGPYGYVSLTAEMLEVEVTVTYGKATAVGTLRYVPELRYPLMYIKELKV